MYSKNISNFLFLIYKDKKIQLDLNDEIVREALIARGGEVVHPAAKEALSK
jgi:NAD(P) transhydrogenase subunit alpha